MKCHSILPLTALMAIICIQLAVYWQWLPPGLQLVEQWQQRLGDDFYALLLLIIFLESIVYLGFYLPGQFIAMVLVVLAKPDVTDIAMLTLTMVVGATLGSACNYALGCLSASGEQNATPYSVKSLLPAMIHINALAFYTRDQWKYGVSGLHSGFSARRRCEGMFITLRTPATQQWNRGEVPKGRG